jgi:hypothetical protein
MTARCEGCKVKDQRIEALIIGIRRVQKALVILAAVFIVYATLGKAGIEKILTAILDIFS